jgi:hypothetical protein
MDFPQITIERPRLRYWQWLALRGSPFLAIPVVGAVAGVATHNRGLAYGGLVALGIVIVLAAVEIPLLHAAFARRQRRQLESWSLPPGTLFAAQAYQVGYLAGAASGAAGSRSGLRRGRLILDDDGVQFQVSRSTNEAWDTTLTWHEIARMDAGPGISPRSARLSAVTTDGKTVTWRFDGLDRLSAALDRLRRDRNAAGTRPVRPASAPPAPGDGTAQGWYADPTGRHELRWFSAGRATPLVKDGTAESREPA